jgi:hypothetical protein
MEAFDLGWDGMDEIVREVLGPEQCLKIEPALKKPNWLYRYRHKRTGWLLSIATHAEPDCHKFSLGGFRIAPLARVAHPGYNNDREALDLSAGMEKKVAWSRITQVGGPLGYHRLSEIVGGKCVLLPDAGSRIGEAADFGLLDFAITCLRDFESTSGVQPITGQDLGHGIMSDGVTSSLEYLHERFPASTIADTSKPTGEGNFAALRGGLEALELPLNMSKVGLIGAGNVGGHVASRLLESGATVYALDSQPVTLERLRGLGVYTWQAAQKAEFLSLPIDALVVNANGSSLDSETVDAIIRSQTLKIIAGSENLALSNPEDERRLLAAKKLYCPTEFCGMMGYLSAVESYLSYVEGVPFELEGLFDKASRLAVVAAEAIGQILKQDYSVTFEEAVVKLYS